MLLAEFELLFRELLCEGVLRTGWWFCMEARSASVSIDWVEGALLYCGVGLEPVGTGDMRGDDCEG